VFRFAALLLTLAVGASGQVAILQIQVVEGESAIHQPGARSSRPLIVEISDETGKPISGAAVSFHLPEDGPGGTFANGLRTDVAVTDARGRATIRAFQANRTSGRFQIRIVASKEQARAGTVSFQYIAELKPGMAAKATAASSSHTRRWMVIAGVIGAGAVGGLLASHGGSTPASPTPPTPPAFSIGSPTLSVGKP
jgi:hypothetical protein